MLELWGQKIKLIWQHDCMQLELNWELTSHLAKIDVIFSYAATLEHWQFIGNWQHSQLFLIQCVIHLFFFYSLSPACLVFLGF